jgi:hypothetical protein
MSFDAADLAQAIRLWYCYELTLFRLLNNLPVYINISAHTDFSKALQEQV